MNILALDTSTDACSVALCVAQHTYHRFELAPREHTSRVLPMIDAVLVDGGLTIDQLDAIAFCAGPGSFTGLRIATSITQGIALAHDLPTVPVSTLATLALGAAREHGSSEVLPTIDARRGQIYWARYRIDIETQNVQCVHPDSLDHYEALPKNFPAGTAMVGTALRDYREQLHAHLGNGITSHDSPLYPNAIDALRLAQLQVSIGAVYDAAEANAVYFRRGV